MLDTKNPLRILLAKLVQKLRSNRGEVDPGEGEGEGAGEGAGAGEGNWNDGMPEDMRSNPNINKYKSLEEFGKGHLNVVQKVGEKGVIVPKEGASQEEIDKFYNTMGRPDKPEGYSFGEVEGLHKGIETSPEGVANLKKTLHGFGLSNAQASGLYKWYMNNISEGLTKHDASVAEGNEVSRSALKREWGKDYDNNITIANRLLTHFGGKETVDAFGDLTTNPGALKFLANLGKKISEDSFTTMGNVDLTIGKMDAQRRIKTIESQIMKMNGNEANYKDLIQEKNRLYNVAYEEGE